MKKTFNKKLFNHIQFVSEFVPKSMEFFDVAKQLSIYKVHTRSEDSRIKMVMDGMLNVEKIKIDQNLKGDLRAIEKGILSAFQGGREKVY
jgi:DNA-binding protein YbaB